MDSRRSRLRSPTRRHRRYSVEDRAKFLAAYRTSGMSQSRFARTQGLSLSTLRYWLSRERYQGKGRASSTFVPVQVKQAPRSPIQVPSPSDFEVTLCSGRILHIPSGFDPEEVRTLVAILEGSCSP